MSEQILKTIKLIEDKRQKKVEEKLNEITAIPKLLDTIQVKGSVITIDAMGTQTEIAEKIKQKRADYTLAVKETKKICIKKSIEHNKENKHSCVCYEKNIELIEKSNDGCYNENV